MRTETKRVLVLSSLVGNGFAYDLGDKVDEAEFSKNVGNGWDALCAPTTDTETADLKPCMEQAVTVGGRRKRRS
jgi:hypothetical protein